MVENEPASLGSFIQYLKRSHLLLGGVAFNFGYYFCVLIIFLYLMITGSVGTTVYTMDFQVFYEAGQEFLISPGNIYFVAPNGLPFRYLPSFAAYMSLFAIIPLYALYILNITMMMIFSILIVYAVYAISVKRGVLPSTKNFERTLAIVAITPPNVVNLILGQISQLVILLVLLVLFLLLVSSEHSIRIPIMIGLLIGIAITIKPFCVVFLPFLVPFTLKRKLGIAIPFKKFGGVFFGFLVSMIPNIVYFFLYPFAFMDFIHVNLVEGLSYHHSTSITRLAVALLPFIDTNILQYAVILTLGGYIFSRNYISFIRSPMDKKRYTHHFASMMFLVLLVYPDSWFLFLSFWYALLAPSMLQLYSSPTLQEGEKRKLDTLWAGSNNLLAFFSIGIVLYYLVLGLDPITPIWLIVLYVLYQRISNSE
ncbi:MAG: DUF2029 domain-containing protein [Candidatus Thorarchaeota archaeon]|nr:DUF2029 domain-containing protein [Candidatus Thorarchaeota archaeon]